VRVGVSIGDIVAGMYLVQGVLASLITRAQTGRGQKIDIAMLDAQIAILEHAVALTTATGVPPGRTGARHPTITPFETFHAEDGLFVIAAGNNSLFAKLCTALRMGPLYEDPRFASNPARCENARLLKRLIEAITVEKPRQHWIEVLEAAGVPTGPIQNVAEALADPQILSRNMLVDIDPAPGRAAFRCAGNPIKMSELPEHKTRSPAPLLDGDRQAVLDWLGMADATVA